MERAEKNEQLQFLEERLSQAPMTLCADYRGLTVAQLSRVRRELRQAGATAKVVKDNLARISAERVLKSADAEKRQRFMDLFEGPSFLIFAGSDVIAPAKAAAQFAKDLEHFSIKGGWFEGSFLNKEQVVELSKMPSREEMLARLLNLMTVPATQIVRLLSAPATQLVRVIEAYRAKLEKSS
jgi:large subunit ribosomal protein L10